MKNNSIKNQLPLYECFKIVNAGKISCIQLAIDGGAQLEFENIPKLKIEVSKEYMEKHKPYKGGYFVQYGDAYMSFSPAEAFESGYRLKK